MTNHVAPGNRDLARRLLTYEAGDVRERPTQVVAAGERVLQELTDHLARWFGTDGVDALFARALDRTRIEFPVLVAIVREAPGKVRVGELTDATPSHDPAVLAEGLVALIAAMIGLLERLVGVDMARRLVEQRWPERTAGAPDTQDGENTKPNTR